MTLHSSVLLRQRWIGFPVCDKEMDPVVLPWEISVTPDPSARVTEPDDFRFTIQKWLSCTHVVSACAEIVTVDTPLPHSIYFLS
jgi:hypothetical protein